MCQRCSGALLDPMAGADPAGVAHAGRHLRLLQQHELVSLQRSDPCQGSSAVLKPTMTGAPALLQGFPGLPPPCAWHSHVDVELELGLVSPCMQERRSSHAASMSSADTASPPSMLVYLRFRSSLSIRCTVLLCQRTRQSEAAHGHRQTASQNILVASLHPVLPQHGARQIQAQRSSSPALHATPQRLLSLWKGQTLIISELDLASAMECSSLMATSTPSHRASHTLPNWPLPSSFTCPSKDPSAQGSNSKNQMFGLVFIQQSSTSACSVLGRESWLGVLAWGFNMSSSSSGRACQRAPVPPNHNASSPKAPSAAWLAQRLHARWRS